MSELFTLPNAVSHLVEKKEPWKIKIKLPEFESKAGFRQWIQDPTTKYLMYSCCEGLDPQQRVTSDNPGRHLYGVIADWDVKLTDSEYETLATKIIDSEHKAQWLSRSFSGGAHALWLFEKPILMHGSKPTRRILTRIYRELKLDKLAPGFDRAAFLNPHTYYNLGRDWKRVSEERMPCATLNYWQYEESRTQDFENTGTEIPLETVRAEVDRRFPGLWTGPFEDGSRGRYFWASPPGTNPTATIVRPTGMVCFSGDQPFYTWSEILGPQFVSQFEVSRIGKCIEAYHYDGKNYFIEENNRSFIVAGKEEALLDIQCRHGLSNRRGRNENVSEAQRALFMIHTNKRVEAAVPFAFVKSRIVTHEGHRYFNTATQRPLAYADDHQKWGENFPKIAEWLEGMFGKKQLKHQLDWLAYAYQNAVEGDPRKGHAHLLVGPPNCGKTLYNTVILGGLFGGHMKASEYLVGKTDFNDHLFESGLWTVDDEAPSASTSVHTSFTAKIKEFVANDTFVVSAKFKKSGRVYWRGRLSITLNDDPVSLRLLPDLDMSIMDKLMIFYCKSFKGFTSGFKETVVSELPYLARYLYDYEIPSDRVDVRFGVKAYANPDVVAMHRADSRYAHIIELLHIFRKMHLNEGDEWEGTCSELMMLLGKMDGCKVLLKDMSPKNMGWGLSHLSSKGTSWLKRSDVKGSYKWVIKGP